MSARSAKNLPASIHQRLLNKARESGRSFNELLQYFGMERFLYRLSVSPYRDRFTLKGALMFAVWHAPLSRPTRDIDFLGRLKNDPDALVEAIKQICSLEVEPDGMVFDPGSVRAEVIMERVEYEGLRVSFLGRLSNARMSLRLDIGFGDVVFPSARSIRYPVLLDFQAPRLLGYTRESVIAEKLEAMVRHGALNSRMKDLYDIWLLARQFDFQGSTLATAISKTFARRNSELPTRPIALASEFIDNPEKPRQWQAFVRTSRLDGAPDFATAMAVAADFLVPVITALTRDKAFTAQWRAPGPWSAMRTASPLQDGLPRRGP